jgi:hypothetical protein
MVWSPPPTDEQCREAYDASRTYPTLAEAARSIGKTVTCLKWRAGLYQERGLGDHQPQKTDPSQPPMDMVERHKLNTENTRLRGIIKSLTDRVAAAEDHRSSILGLEVLPAEPIAKPKPIKKSAAAAPRPSSCTSQTSTLAKSSTGRR